MTIDEASQCYGIPLDVLQEYEKVGLCDAVKSVMASWQYDDADIERLGLIMTLHEIGFSAGEVETYMRLLLSGEDTKVMRLNMLSRMREQFLNELHLKQKHLDWIDYLRYQIENGKEVVV